MSNIPGQMIRFNSKHLVLWPMLTSLFIVLCYWWHVHPPGFSTVGYYEDYCGSEIYRHIFADQLKNTGQIKFYTDRLMAPFGIGIGYSGVYIERELLGALFWLLDRKIPYLWIMYCVSLLVIWYAGARTIQQVAQTQKPWTWFLAAWIAIFNIPRHEKTYYHHDQVFVHWTYLSLFMDLWIWDRVVNKREWDLRWEVWRGFLAVGCMMGTGYSWGLMFFQWILVRGFILKQWRHITIIKPSFKGVRTPLTLASAMLVLLGYWMTQQILAVIELERVAQPESNWAHWTAFFVPVGYDFVVALLEGTWRSRTFSNAFNLETQITVGFALWGLAFLGFVISKNKKRVIPFLVFALWTILFISSGTIRHWSKMVLPTMGFFRVIARMGLYLSPALFAVLIATLPDWTRFLKTRSKGVRIALVSVFGLLIFTETLWLIRPIRAMQPLGEPVVRILERAKSLPGDTILDLPFCVAGGNGVCTWEQCHRYPFSYAGACFSTWHDKKVYGAYLGRMVDSQCQIYRKPPYNHWFDSWFKERCFSETEWDEFCKYLDDHPNISAVHLYPDVWLAARTPECQAQFAKHLGPPLDEAVFEVDALDLVPGFEFGRIQQYLPRCKK